jgi:hypothetical protein
VRGGDLGDVEHELELGDDNAEPESAIDKERPSLLRRQEQENWRVRMVYAFLPKLSPTC